ncbi:MAG TPA: stalk domain-containing protein [Candidatus Deferrimicrobium sp.]|nr:stalk domain-containing protein [Candidatus Deferrimicrobium sp.]
MRKILSIFIAACLVLSLCASLFVSVPSAKADTEGDYTYTVNGGNATITGYTGSGGEVDIPDTLGRYLVKGIALGVFRGCTQLTRVVVPGSVTSIGNAAFNGCTGLTAAFFLGNAPTMGTGVFDSCATGFTVGHIGGTTGWTNPWFTYPTITLNTTTYTLTVTIIGSGSLSKSPDQSLYVPGSVITFTATPATGTTFTGWSGDLSGTTNPTQITMDANKTITATFANISTKEQAVIVLQIGKSTFTVNGISNGSLDSPPIIKNGRTLVPVRTIIEALRGSVGWDGTARKATVTLGSTTIELWIGKNVATVNGKNTPIDSTNAKVVPEIINARTMLPLRFVSENLGCSVVWAAATQTITITYTP